MSSSRNDNISWDILIQHIRRRYAEVEYPEAWRNLPEIPTKEELMPNKDRDKDRYTPETWNAYQEDPIYDPNLPHNIIDGPWPSTMEYLGAHYQILREDAIAPLRTSIQQFRDDPKMNDSRETHIYTDVSSLPPRSREYN
jgi:helicase required for RNAi-mediated heterochromatin assembly 1